MQVIRSVILTGWCLALTAGGFAQPVERFHKKSVVADTHNDVLSSSVLDGKDISQRLSSGHSDLERWMEGGVDVQFFSVFTGPEPRNKEGCYKDANQQIDSLENIAARNTKIMTLVKDYRALKKALRQKKLAALIGVEGGHMIEDDLKKLETLHQRGMSYMTLTWNNSTSWATSARDETDSASIVGREKKTGLSEFGKQIVKRMNELGIIVDLSHTGEQAFYDALAITTRPVLLSHSSVWSICPVFRNVKDEQIKAVAKNAGVICINYYPGFISKQFDLRSEYLEGPGKKHIQDSMFAVYRDSAKLKSEWKNYYEAALSKVRPTLGQVVDHIDYVVQLVGDDYVGLGSDFDGISSVPVGLEDVTTYPKIAAELLRRGYSKKSVRKILGGNVMRVIKANLRH